MAVSRTIACAGLLLSLAAGCAAPVESEKVAATEQELTAVTNIDFNGYPLGPLGAPWTVNTATGGTVTVVNGSGTTAQSANLSRRFYRAIGP